MVDLISAAVPHAHHLLALPQAPPNPGSGKEPPGGPQLKLLLQWLAWMVTAAAVAGILIVAGRMAIVHHQGDDEGGSHFTGLGWVLAACVLIAAASGIVGAIVGH